MQELISRLSSQVGISEEQSQKVLTVLSEFIKEKYPFAGGMIDNLLSKQGGTAGQEEEGGGLDLGGFKF